MITDYHAKYFAYELTKRSPSDSLEKLTGAVASAQVDLNPHQVDAALFAFQSPLSKGALLADEVGLGKTIEAGLVISQRWAERKKRILIITPANLRKQWQQELSEKFFLPCTILETRNYNQMIKQAYFRPFEINESIVICSYQFARNKAADVANTPWDLVVIDEAHRLRNVYKPSNIIANTLKAAIGNRHKLLLTATPLQNSLLELFGLVSFIDDHTFGDLKSFREQFLNLNHEEVFDALKSRLRPVCHRTLRRQLNAYVPYTNRHALVEEFVPEDSEDKLYDLVTEYLQRSNLQALPSGQRTLMTLVLRKLLASSTFAIAGALHTLSNRLKTRIKKAEPPTQSLTEDLNQDYEALTETEDEWSEESVPNVLTEADRKAIEAEIADLDQFAELAAGIDHNAKGKALLKGLAVALEMTKQLGGAEKAIIFTESRRTQDYLLRVLRDSNFSEGIVLFNGSNTDETSKQIYSAWIDKHQGTDRVTGSRTADMRSAIVDYFREEGRIMIATEAGAEGINLQFCSLVINYDLPWNPQRIEQRIGRCHRYGQQHDVVVVNFLNKKNEADQRVYRLLSEKFKLFDGVFGASDEVLGAIESGVDFEKRIANIYQECRKPEEIKQAFDQLQLELNFEISETITQTRQKLLENFDDEVREKLRLRDKDSRSSLNKYERILIALSQHELRGVAEFVDDSSFNLKENPFPEREVDIPLGLYELPRRSGEAHLYRLNHPLAEAVIMEAKDRPLPLAEIAFDYSGHEGKVTALEEISGQAGWLSATLLSVEALDQIEDYILLSALTDNGTLLDEDQSRRLLTLAGSIEPQTPLYDVPKQVHELTIASQETLLEKIASRNRQFFEVELKKLDGWADDQIASSEKALRDVKKRIRELRNESSKATDLSEQARLQGQISDLERSQRKLRQEIFDVEDRILAQRDELVSIIRGKLKQQTTNTPLFSIRWTLS